MAGVRRGQMPFDESVKVGEVMVFDRVPLADRTLSQTTDLHCLAEVFKRDSQGREYMAVTEDFYFVVGRRRGDVIRKITKRRANAVGSQFCVMQGLESIRGLDTPGYDLVIIKAVGVIGVGVNYASCIRTNRCWRAELLRCSSRWSVKGYPNLWSYRQNRS